MASPEAGMVQVTVVAEDENGVLYRWTRLTPASSPLRVLTRQWAKEHLVPEEAVGYAAHTAKRGAQEDLDVGKSSQHYGWSSGEEVNICAFPLDEGLAEARRAASHAAPPRKRGRRAKAEPGAAAGGGASGTVGASAAPASPPAPPAPALAPAAAAAARPPAGAAPAPAAAAAADPAAGAPPSPAPAPVAAAAAGARPPAAAPAPAKVEVEAKAKAEVEAKSTSEAEVKVKAEAEVKAKADAQAKAEVEAQSSEADALAEKAEAEEAVAKGSGAAAAGEEAALSKRQLAKEAYSAGDRYTQFSGEPPPSGDDPIEYSQQNPKKIGSQGHERYEKYKKARTPNEALSLGSAKGDLLHDWKKGFYKRAA